MNRKKTSIILISFFILLGAVFSFYIFKIRNEVRTPALTYWGGDAGSSIRPFTFINQDGDTITEQDVKGKILVVEYFFTTCKSICPIMNEQMSRVYESVRMDDEVLILSHTVDPENDTVEALKAYSQKFNADAKHWMFLTGTKEDLYNQAFQSYKIAAKENEGLDIEDQFIHSPDFVLVDKEGKLRAHKGEGGQPILYKGTDSASVSMLIEDIQTLKKEG